MELREFESLVKNSMVLSLTKNLVIMKCNPLVVKITKITKKDFESSSV